MLGKLKLKQERAKFNQFNWKTCNDLKRLQVDLECCNPNLGLVIKAKACKVASQKWSPGIKIHAPINVGQCEGMNLHTPKWAPTLGIGIPMDFQFFKEKL
jgi:hypothetical protein